MPKTVLDDLNRRILTELRENARQTNVEIAKAIGVSEATVRRRILNLMESGIARLIVGVNPLELGFHVEVMINLRAEVDKVESVATELARYEEVNYLGVMTGDFDILVHALFRTTEEVYQFIRQKIAPIEGVRDVHTSYVLRVIKRTNRWILVEDNKPI